MKKIWEFLKKIAHFIKYVFLGWATWPCLIVKSNNEKKILVVAIASAIIYCAILVVSAIKAITVLNTVGYTPIVTVLMVVSTLALLHVICLSIVSNNR